MKTATSKNGMPNMPEELRRICYLFDDANITYLLFKCEHILAGENKNLDVLLKTAEDYTRASRFLEQQGYILYMGEEVERYKKMYVSFDGKIVSAVHLHREVAWHGVIALDKENIFQRAQGIIPAPEDSLLIHSAHALFENFMVQEHQRLLLEKYKGEAKDWVYVDSQLARFGWKKQFHQFIRDFSVNKALVLKTYSSRLRKDPLSALVLSTKMLKRINRGLSIRRRGYLISLIGMNGSGKSTTAESLLAAYRPLTSFVAGQKGYYFGWKQSFLSKISSLFSKKDEKLFDKVSEENNQKFSLFQECLFLYIYLRFLLRFFLEIYPSLRKNILVITDRYFYDLYGQYPYSERCILLKLLPMPKPDKLILLDANVSTVMGRDKAGKGLRIVQPQEKLEGQRRRYLALAEKVKELSIIDTEDDLQKNVCKIIRSTWEPYLHKRGNK